ncbi:MAG: putative small protein [Alphaproteobacteria bacterium]|nr:putative small protein [Alphaproteobacteria bacterium]MDB5721198.1 putative small protein [Alphaproteobacteria bacterium]
MPNARTDTPFRPAAPVDEAVRAIVDSINRIRFGSIAITLHEGKVVQLDITEKRRL